MRFDDLVQWAVLKDTGKSVDEDCLQVAAAAGVRNKGNWTFPAILGVLVLILNVFYKQAHGPEGIWLGGRVILMDWFLFFVGWFVAWNAAQRWRRNQEFLEDMAITHLVPETVGKVMFAGALQIWFVVLMVIAGVDVLLNIPYMFDAVENGAHPVTAVILFATSIPCYVVLAWFHLESMRISYWMFSLTALPGKNLRAAAILNLILVGAYVLTLTSVGSALTGVMFVMVMAFGAIPTQAADINLSPYWVDVAWYLSAIPGLIVVGLIKRTVCGSYEAAFRTRYLFMLWWGTAEKNHPESYPAVTSPARPMAQQPPTG